MKKAFLTALIATICVCSMGLQCQANSTNSEAYIPSDITIIAPPTAVKSFTASLEHEKVETTDLDELQNLIELTQEAKNSAHEMAESARELGYDETHQIIVLAKQEWNYASENYEYYSTIYNEELARQEAEAEAAKWDKKMSEYPEATQIWLYLKSLEFNDWVCAGIMGNIMTEAGGQTLNIQPTIYGGNYYGICQWSGTYFPEVQGTSLSTQLDFLSKTLQSQMETGGYSYQSFLNLKNEQSAALTFAKYYERCGSGSYYTRQSNATKAYDYFVD